uniref:Uncharacterized protein n=1 Tax=Glycine max TaxID=3847 RepID=A0A0R0GD12_SOYBN
MCFDFPLPVLFFFLFFFTACSLFLLKLPFFFLPPFEDDALVLLFSKCRTKMTEMPNGKLKDLCQCNNFWFFSKATLTMSLYIPWNS